MRKVADMAEFNWRVGIFLLCLAGSAVVVGSCSNSGESEKRCVSSGDSRVCAWRDGTVQLSTEGLEPGSAFHYVATTRGPDPIEGFPGLEVGDDGTVPGVLGVMSGPGGEVTLDITAVAAGGQPLTGRLVIG